MCALRINANQAYSMLDEGKEASIDSQEPETKKKNRKKQHRKVRFSDRMTTRNRKQKSPKSNEKGSQPQREDVYWEIEDILDERLAPGGIQEVLIKWKGWSSKHNSWEPVSHLNDDLEKVLATLEKEKEDKKERAEKCKQQKKKIKKQKPYKPKSDEDDLYVIQDILDEKVENGQTYYYIKWAGFSDEWNSWEPRKNLVASNIAALKKRIKYEKQNHKPALGEENQSGVHIPLTRLREAQITAEKTLSEGSKAPEKENNERMLAEEDINSSDLAEEKIGESDDGSAGNTPWMTLRERQRELREKKEQLKLKEMLLEEELLLLKRGMTSEDILTKRFDMPESYFNDEDKRHGPEDKDFYDHRIDSHRCDEDGQIEALKVVATSKEELLGAPIVFWCDIADAREKFAQETMEYLLDLKSEMCLTQKFKLD